MTERTTSVIPLAANSPERETFDALIYQYPHAADMLADVILEVSARMLAPLRDELAEAEANVSLVDALEDDAVVLRKTLGEIVDLANDVR